MKKDMIPMAALEQRVIEMTTAQKALIFLLTYLVLCVGFYYVKYKPQSENLAALKTSIEAQEKKLVELKKAAAQAQALEAEVAKMEEEFNQLLALLPDQREIPGLLDSISRLASQAGLEQVSFQPQPEQPMDFYAVIPVRLELVGSYHQLGVFFDRVSKLDRIVKFDNLSLTRLKEPPKLQVSCTVVTYRFVEKTDEKSAKPGQKK
jgi:type IV pilus assembly protein PilO